MTHQHRLRPGDWVEVRSLEEVLPTLDANGQLEGLPFMPEMLALCGRRFRVSKRAHKTCDPPNGLGGRSMPGTVHLEGARCHGEFHGGCQHLCLMFWKEVWLKKADGPGEAAETLIPLPGGAPDFRFAAAAAEPIMRGSCRPDVNGLPSGSSGEPAYVCQSTQIAAATKPIPWWDLRQYLEDYSSGNVRLTAVFASLFVHLCRRLETSRLGLGWGVRTGFDFVQRLRGRPPYPWRLGLIPHGLKTPSKKLNLQPGELVRVKSYTEILKTLNQDGHNRGMWFDPEMVPYCGGTYRVLDRVVRVVNEKTGRIQVMKNDCIILENVVCKACYIKKQRFCPRGIYPFWREIWLERVSPVQASNPVNIATGETVLQSSCRSLV